MFSHMSYCKTLTKKKNKQTKMQVRFFHASENGINGLNNHMNDGLR